MEQRSSYRKALVGDLNEAGAVWLEKRRGYPYDYTVLLINHDHPNVLALHAGAPDEGSREQTTMVSTLTLTKNRTVSIIIRI